MPTITVQTPFAGEPLIVTWHDRQMNVSGSVNALMIWDHIKSQGLYGKYGHTLDPENCFFVDVVIAIANRVGPDEYSLNEEAEAQLQREADHERRHPIPKGAVT